MPALQGLQPRAVDALIGWYEKNQRDFPWRRDPNPYWVWLAEIMSQQTVMAALMPYFHRFIEKFPTVAALAAASEDEVLAAWTGLGYYSRARNVQRAARAIVAAGAFPRSLEGWLELPGVGPYTAAAVASQCFGVEAPVWDGNVTRVCSRLDARDDALTTAFRAEMQTVLREKMRGRNASQFNQAMMELGATVCTPQTPSCGACPLESGCRAWALDAVAKFPPPKPRKANIDLKCRVQVRLRRVRGGEGLAKYEALVERRSEFAWFSGMWDFPSELGGAQLPVRPLAFEPARAEKIGETKHQITNHRIRLEAWMSLENGKCDAGKWLTLDELTAERTPVPLSTTARKIIKILLRRPDLLV